MVLRAIKAIHTLVWAFFAGCVLAIPALGLAGRYALSALFAGVVGVEVVILLANRGRCPLTDLAARHTSDRSDNFDIYLPRWLARHNKTIFGALYVAGSLLAFARWRAG